MTPRLCSTPYLLCSFDTALCPNMTTEFLSRCLCIPVHPTIHIVRMQLYGPVLHIQGPTSRLNGIYKDYTILQRQLILIYEDKNKSKYYENRKNCNFVLLTVHPITTLGK